MALDAQSSEALSVELGVVIRSIMASAPTSTLKDADKPWIETEKALRSYEPATSADHQLAMESVNRYMAVLASNGFQVTREQACEVIAVMGEIMGEDGHVPFLRALHALGYGSPRP